MPVEAPPRPAPEQEELDALIEEARRRSRRRRLRNLALVAAAAIVGTGAYLVIGGGGNGANPKSSPDGRGPAGGAPAQPSAAAKAYRCPTSIAALKRSSPRSGIPGCSIRFWADLPPAWHESPSRVQVVPAAIPGGMPFAIVRFANHSPPASPLWPIPMPHDGIAIGIFPEEPVAKSDPASGGAADINPRDFHHVSVQRHQPVATTNLYTGGWRFQVQVRVGTTGPDPESLAEANAVLNSIETTQHLCPCGAKHSASGP